MKVIGSPPTSDRVLRSNIMHTDSKKSLTPIVLNMQIMQLLYILVNRATINNLKAQDAYKRHMDKDVSSIPMNSNGIDVFIHVEPAKERIQRKKRG